MIRHNRQKERNKGTDSNSQGMTLLLVCWGFFSFLFFSLLFFILICDNHRTRLLWFLCLSGEEEEEECTFIMRSSTPCALTWYIRNRVHCVRPVPWPLNFFFPVVLLFDAICSIWLLRCVLWWCLIFSNLFWGLAQPIAERPPFLCPRWQ